MDGVAPATKELVDEEVRRLLEECYAQAVEALQANRERLDALAHTLVEQETLDEDAAYAAAGLAQGAEPATMVRRETAEFERAPAPRSQPEGAGQR